MDGTLETACRICGLDVDDLRFDVRGLPLFVICECCGGESGYEASRRTRHVHLSPRRVPSQV